MPLGRLLPGEILLFCNKRSWFGDFIGRTKAWFIAYAQRNEGFKLEDARWHHAGIYMGDGIAAEAVPKLGLARTPLKPAYNEHEILPRSKLGMTALEGGRVAAAADERVRAKLQYNYGLIAQIVAAKYAKRLGIFGRLLPPLARLLAQEGEICTTLCRHSYAAALGIDIFHSKRDLRAIMPANISETDLLE